MRRFDRVADAMERVPGVPPGSANPQPVDHGLAGWTFDPADQQGGTILPTAGRLEVMRVRAASSLITNILLTVTVAGGTLTSGRNFAALFTDAGALLSTTADQTTPWGTTGLKTAALSAAQTVTPGAFYRIGLFSNGTTLPTFARASVAFNGAALNPGQSAPTFRFSTADTGLTTAMPANLGAQTSGATAWWAALS